MADQFELKPFKVWNANRSRKVTVVANNFEHLISKGTEKLGLNPTNDVQLVLEEDGTEVDEDYLPFVQANTVLMLLSANEHWSSQKGMVTADLLQQKETKTKRATQYTLTPNLTLGTPITDESSTFTAPIEEVNKEKYKIFGRGSHDKKITKWQAAVNDEACKLAMEEPALVLSRGELMNKAKEKVKVDYPFAKGRSRSKSDESPENSPKVKRAKLHSEERSRQIKLMQENLKTLSNWLSFKQQQLEKEHCISNFKQCDMICKEMMEIRKERASVDQQLAALVKKEAKSSWYHKKGSNKTKKVHGENKKKQCQDNQQSLPSLLKKKSSNSSTCSSDHQSDDTIIMSDESVEIGKDPEPCSNEDQGKEERSKEERSDEEMPIFSQTPPEITAEPVEGSQTI